jgi:hypothetical protein
MKLAFWTLESLHAAASTLRTFAGPVGLLVWLALIGAYAAVLGPEWVHWRRRRRAWLTTPERLLQPRPRPAGLYVLATVLATAAGVAGLVLRGPLPVLAAALAVLTVYHLTAWGGLAPLGLAGVVGACVAAAQRWMHVYPWSTTIGLATAAVLLFALGHYWSRQLDSARAWTTAGRLEPWTRIVGMATVALGVLAAMSALARIP